MLQFFCFCCFACFSRDVDDGVKFFFELIFILFAFTTLKLMLLMGMMMMIQQSSSSHFAPYIEGTAARALSVCFLVSLVCINSSSNGCYYFVVGS